MIDTSSISLKALQGENLHDVLQAVESVLQKRKIPFYLIGAQARDIQLIQQGMQPYRATRDVDFAMMISSLDGYKSILEELMQQYDFTPDRFEPYRLIHNRTKTVLDLLPFGEIAQKGYVRFHDRNETELSVIGMKEVYEVSQTVTLDGRFDIKVAPLQGICILKLLAWQQHPEVRTKDIDDFKFILQHYFDLNSDEIYEKHLDLFGENFVPEKVAARVMGRHLQTLLERSALLKEKIQQILRENATNPEESRMGELMIAGTDKSVAEACQIITEILKGTEDTWPT